MYGFEDPQTMIADAIDLTNWELGEDYDHGYLTSDAEVREDFLDTLSRNLNAAFDSDSISVNYNHPIWGAPFQHSNLQIAQTIRK